jgi:PiT family inorganic phosphate transporter
MNDAANTVATVISTRALTPIAAVIMGGVLNLGGAFFGAIVGTAVAKTIGKGIIPSDEMTQLAVTSAIAASVIWVFLATRLGLPVSVSHSLIAAVVGAGGAVAGFGALDGTVLTKVLLALAFSPILGFFGGFLLMSLLFWLLRRQTPSAVNAVSSKLQILAAAFLSFSHGRNDSQNAIGIIALAWTVYQTARLGSNQELEVTLWMVALSAITIGLGTAIGGWRVIRTLGMRVTRLEPIGGATANVTAASVIEAATVLGLPVSTTHTSASAIIGVGSTRRFSAVRWGITRSIAMAWLVTYPVCLALGYTISKLFAVIT